MTAIVWSRYPVGAGEMLLALALADQATDAGEYIAIDMGRLAKKTRQTKETVKGHLSSMVEAGWLEQMEGSKAFRISPAWLGSTDAAAPAAAGDKKAPALGTRLPKDWMLPAEWQEWALKEFPAWTAEYVKGVAAQFRDHWLAASGQNARKVDWSGTWRNWCRRCPPVPPAAGSGTAGTVTGEWWKSSSGIDKKGTELGLTMQEGEIYPAWRARVYRAAGDGPWMDKQARDAAPRTQGFKQAGQLATQEG